jgi:hypothetical protein
LKLAFIILKANFNHINAKFKINIIKITKLLETFEKVLGKYEKVLGKSEKVLGKS